MNSPQTVALNSVTQYSVTLQNSVPASGTLPEIQTSYSYTGPGHEPTGGEQPELPGEPFPVDPHAVLLRHVPDLQRELQHQRRIPAGRVLHLIFKRPILLQRLRRGLSESDQSTERGHLHLLHGVSERQCGQLLCKHRWGRGCLRLDLGRKHVVHHVLRHVDRDLVRIHNHHTRREHRVDGFALTNSQYTTSYGEMQAYVTNVVWSVTYTTQVSGSTTSTTQAADLVSGNSVTYTYTVGYAFPSGSSATSWSATVPSGETYLSNNCSGATVSGSTMTDVSGASCTMTATGNGTYASTAASPTGDSWFDSGSVVSIGASASGKFTFSQWTSSSALTIASATSASTTVQVNTYGTITAGFSVNE